MINFNKIYTQYKAYLEENSEYGVEVKKHTTNKSTKFPLITFEYRDTENTNDATVDGIEYYDREYFNISIYAQDKNNVSAEIIIDELRDLTQKFMGRYLGMERTTCKRTFNLDTSVLRVIMKYQCQVGNVYGNIIRR
jgi:hypothetical protein